MVIKLQGPGGGGASQVFTPTKKGGRGIDKVLAMLKGEGWGHTEFEVVLHFEVLTMPKGGGGGRDKFYPFVRVKTSFGPAIFPFW